MAKKSNRDKEVKPVVEEVVEETIETTEDVNEEVVEEPKKKTTYGTVSNCQALRVRNTPNANSDNNIIRIINVGDKVSIVDEKRGWIKIAEDEYVMSKFVTRD